ncbi:MAG: hypothetical protein HY043_06655 [Verrucomicrobia bacterium]|nr:hypothetical protein [Verrucomicrobiota bacterium]
MTKLSSLRSSVWVWVCCLFAVASTRSFASAGDLKLQAQLVWATNEEKPANKKLTDLDAKLTEKLRRVFKWKNYFEVSRQNPISVQAPAKKVAMSAKCEVELRRVDDATVEVKLYGEGKLLKTDKHPIKSLLQGEYYILAGDDKEKYDDAWFVVFSCAKDGK